MKYLLESALQPHTICLTPDALSAQQLQRNVTHLYKNNNAKTHTCPTILSIQDWAQHLWTECMLQNQLGSPPVLLNTYQSQRIWQTIAKQAASDNTTHSLAYAAWEVCHRHQLNYHEGKFKQNTYTQMWQNWAIQFEQQCKAKNWLDPNQVFSWLITTARLDRVTLPQNIVLYGIDRMLPLYNAIFQKLEHYGCHIQQHEASSADKSTKIQSIVYPDSDTQTYDMAQWVWQQWAQGTQSVACIIPHLHTVRDDVINVLQTVFHQQHPQHTGPCPIATPFETIKSLDHPIISTALDLLNLSIPFDFAALSRTLRTPYIKGAKTEYAQRVQLECKLRQHTTALSSIQTLQTWSQQYHCSQFADCLSQHILPSADETHTLTQWARQFKQQLNAWGWPNITPLTPEELQSIQQWRHALDSLSTLDVVEAPCTFTVALQQLIHYLHSELQPLQSSLTEQSLYLIDSQSVAYCGAVDALWIMNSHDIEQDTTTLSNPFIPYTLQEQPSIAPLQNLIQHTHHTVLNTTAAQASITAHKINTLLAGLNVTIENKSSEDNTPYKTLIPSTQWETLEDEQAPPVLTDMTVKNGVDLIYQQANCPFKAFADYRLNLKHRALELPSSTLTIAEKSQLLHKLFNRVWHPIENQTNLNQLSESALDQCIEEALETELAASSIQKPDRWQPVFTQLEKERLHSLLKKGLKREMTRPNFKVIAHPYKGAVTINQLTLSFQIDRLDQLADGTQLLIDYTTRAATPTYAAWADNEKIALQFSLYHLHEKTPIQSISFFNVTPEKQNPFHGISQHNIEIKGIQKMDVPTSQALVQHNWSTLTQHWNTTVQNLAHAFQNGDAAVKPKEGKKTCRYCPYTLLCRVAQHNHSLSHSE